MIRPEVREFISLGRLPSEDLEPDDVLEVLVRRAGELLDRIERPVTDEEALALAECFGDDECFGLAHTLRHTIETAPVEGSEGVRRWRERAFGIFE
ncbi:hypothetical protein OHA72_13085 [Dactylosporangium sp. NBC_01737]|uniref:hypothetical protein n=1 Tax=Dactylosporangium sp. NBC_01737 TaxID=2975959 RepID=UPI002E11E673|nr:hypothetical protein OHA72_13085 [Dactylosporangium sp. NBC_01737]